MCRDGLLGERLTRHRIVELKFPFLPLSQPILPVEGILYTALQESGFGLVGELSSAGRGEEAVSNHGGNGGCN